MKRSELEVGKFYAYQSWIQGTNRLSDIQKVEIISLKPHREFGEYRTTITEADKGNGVLVDLIDTNPRFGVLNPEERRRRMIVQLGKIINDWDEEVSVRQEWEDNYARALTEEKSKAAEKLKWQMGTYDPAFKEFKELVLEYGHQEIQASQSLGSLDLEVIKMLTTALKKTHV